MIRTIVLLSLVFAASSCSPAPKADSKIQVSPTPQRELKKDVPNESWVKIYFEGVLIETVDNGEQLKNKKIGGLDEFAAANGFPILKETFLPENDLEARVWVGFGKYQTDGFILKRRSGNWSATVLKEMLCHLENKGKYELPPPKSGWNEMWEMLVDAGILVLPDSSKLKNDYGVIDGKSYVVETNFDSSYRTYHYGNPDELEFKEAEQMVKIGQIIADEFSLESFSMKAGGCGKK